MSEVQANVILQEMHVGGEPTSHAPTRNLVFPDCLTAGTNVKANVPDRREGEE